MTRMQTATTGTSQQASSTARTPMPTHEQIAKRAYEKWVKRGRPEGTHLQDWYEAEAELKRELASGTYRG